jgi:transposase-like protein
MNPRKNKNVSEKDGLKHKQHQAVAELLKPSNKSYEEVAKALGISSRCLYNWRKDPNFQKALRNGVDELKERVLTAAEFSVQLDSVNSMLDYEAKVLDAMDVREAVIEIMENQESLRLRIEAIVEELEQLQDVVNKVWN